VIPSLERSSENSDEASAVRDNRRRAGLLCAAPGLAVGVVVGIVLIALGLPLVGVVALVVIAIAVPAWLWRFAPSVVVRSVGAHPSEEWEHPRLHNLVDGLCATMGLPGPAVYVVDSPVPNAMTVGRHPSTATLVVTSSLDQSLTLVELEGVLAHELVHIKRYDTLVAGLAVVVMAPWALVAGAVQGQERVHSLVGRGREFSADQRAAGVVRYPPGIGAALAVMNQRSSSGAWPPGRRRVAALTRWLWVDPMAGASEGESEVGNLDHTGVRAAALALR
jgi:Zn-dependent protease with chaperone function